MSIELKLCLLHKSFLLTLRKLSTCGKDGHDPVILKSHTTKLRVLSDQISQSAVPPNHSFAMLNHKLPPNGRTDCRGSIIGVAVNMS